MHVQNMVKRSLPFAAHFKDRLAFTALVLKTGLSPPCLSLLFFQKTPDPTLPRGIEGLMLLSQRDHILFFLGSSLGSGPFLGLLDPSFCLGLKLASENLCFKAQWVDPLNLNLAHSKHHYYAFTQHKNQRHFKWKNSVRISVTNLII